MILADTLSPDPTNHEIVVGNIGTVYRGGSYDAAFSHYRDYIGQSRAGMGRASGEEVSWLKDGEILSEYIPILQLIDHLQEG